MHEPHITLTGNVGRAPRRRATSAGVSVADFRLASTPRRLDRGTSTWSDGETTWFAVTCWRALADHVTDSLQVGDRVVVTGRLSTSTWTTDTGEVRLNLEVEAITVGLDLSWGTAVQERKPKPAVEAWASSGIVDPTTGEVLSAASVDAADRAGAQPLAA